MKREVFQYGKLFEPVSGGKLIERKARRALAYCQHKLELDDIPLPIPVDNWIESAFDIRFGVADLSHLGPDVLGASFLCDREILIAESVLAHEGRYRFTCAHELGHFVLHQHVRDQFQDRSQPEIVLDDAIERDADRFAAAFLMPVNLFEREVVGTAIALNLDPHRCLTELMMPNEQSRRLWEKIFVSALATRFGVSKTATLIRAHGLCLKGADPRPLLPMKFFYEMLPKPALPTPASRPA